jgi:HAD superfamily hydrolase (TIGR01509 family)
MIEPQNVPIDEVDHVILDMDGTLLDLYFDEQVWNYRLPHRYAEIHNLSTTEASARIESLMAPIRGTLSWYCFDHWQSLVGIDLLTIENQVYDLVKTRDGAEAFLIRLGDLPCEVILATNADRRSMTRKLLHTGLSDYFDTIFSSHDFGHAKEDIAFWHSLQNKLGFDPSRTVFIDDNHNVLKAAQQFGIKQLFGIEKPNSQGEQLSSEQFYCVNSFREFTW